jgi:FHA domain-containing protein
MIRIQVTQHNGAVPPQPLFADFGESGGNIGRAEGNVLVLHDPMRVISRVHASVSCHAGGYSIRNLGTAIPVFVNGQALGNGAEAPIAGGDEILIDGYTMKVFSAQRPDLEAGQGPSKDDPLALFGNQPGGKRSDDLLARGGNSIPQRKPATVQGREEQAKRESTPFIPTDFDPFAPVPPTPRPRELEKFLEPGGPGNLGLGPSRPDQSIDELFGLDAGKESQPFSLNSPSLIIRPEAKPGEGSRDPMVVIGGEVERKASGRPTQPDNIPEWQAAFRPPEAKPDSGAMKAVVAGETIPSEVTSSKPYLSWEARESAQDAGKIVSVIVPSPSQDRRKGERRRAQQELSLPGESAPQKTVAEEAQAGERPQPAGQAPDQQELLQAFLNGAGVPDLPLEGFTPEFMQMLGQLLRQSTQGTLDLLRARMLTRREIHAELTMIAPKENNPLKFSPTVEAALAHLLTPQGRGFMDPLHAMQNAYNDLRSHQFGFLAGLRAALAGVLERFSPEELEHRLTQKKVIDALLPMNRKAKLWDLFTERYQDISREAEEDFHALFGREFLRAYDDQIAKLEQEEK